MSWLTARFHRTIATINGAVSYQVVASIDAVNGIPSELFVLRTEDSTYDHVAALYDLLNWPATLLLAQGNPPADFYRVSTVIRQFARLHDAESFVAYAKFTLKNTNLAWASNATAAEDFAADDVVVYDSQPI